MAILNLRRFRAVTWLPLLAMAVTGGGCMLLSRLGSTGKNFAFDHAVHIEEGLDCADCHGGAADADEPGMPVRLQCMLCHEELDAEKPADRRVETLFEGDLLVAAHASRLDPEVVFSHARHVGEGLACSACHLGIETNRRIGPEVRVSMDACTACHAQRGAANDCGSCHREIREDRAPRNHAQNWTRMHGHAVRGGSEALADRCSLCHTESTCVTCHEAEAPANHNGFWRLRGHGVAASFDRAGCAVCHKSDSCEQCHSEARPQSHIGSFGAPMNHHCLGCHTPVQDNGCSACHRDAPSHLEATPMPGWHDPGMNCRQCHGVTQPMTHVDNGSTCTSCHR